LAPSFISNETFMNASFSLSSSCHKKRYLLARYLNRKVGHLL
jgi:hypothetical protein